MVLIPRINPHPTSWQYLLINYFAAEVLGRRRRNVKAKKSGNKGRKNRKAKKQKNGKKQRKNRKTKKQKRGKKLKKDPKGKGYGR